MGSLKFIDAFDARDYELGEARPVGKIESVIDTSATLVRRVDEDVDGYSQYVFAEEVPLQFVGITRSGDALGVAVRRNEFKLMPGSTSIDVSPGTRLVIAQVPHSGHWTVIAPLRPRRGDRPAVLRDAADVEELQDAIRASDKDLFETRKGVLTAAIEEEDFRIFFSPRLRANYQGLAYALGLINGSAGKLEALHAIELEILNSRRLVATLKAVASGAPVGFKSNLFVPEALRDELPSLLHWSVRQALAGPGAEQDPAAFIGRPVGLYARHIFMDHAHNLTRSAPETGGNLAVDEEMLERGDHVSQQLARFLATRYS